MSGSLAIEEQREEIEAQYRTLRELKIAIEKARSLSALIGFNHFSLIIQADQTKGRLTAPVDELLRTFTEEEQQTDHGGGEFSYQKCGDLGSARVLITTRVEKKVSQ